MHVDHAFRVIDVHCGGAPARVVLSGLPPTPGKTPMDRMEYFSRHHDWIRRALILEPRGRGATSGIVLVEPSDPRADIAAFFMEAHGYLPMCGSDIIATVTVLIETGQLPSSAPSTTVTIETPAGLITATAACEGSRVTSVTFTGAPAFCAVSQGIVNLPDIGDVSVDVSYGGNFYAIVPAAQVGIELSPTSTRAAVEMARVVRQAVNDTYRIEHPTLPQVRGVSHVQFFVPPVVTGDPTTVMVIMPTGVVDRSPCGTGTTAKVATLLSQGKLTLGESFVHQSVTGARFAGRATELTTEGGLAACRVAITGRAFATADATVLLDDEDELAAGFELV